MLFNDIYFYYSIMIGIIVLGTLVAVSEKDMRIAVFLIIIAPLLHAILNYSNLSAIKEETATGIAGYLRGIIYGVCGLAGIIHFIKKSNSQSGKLTTAYIFLLIYIIFAFSSSVYSIDPPFTIIRSLFFLCLFLTLIGLNKWIDGKLENINKIISVLSYAVSLVIILCIISLFFPSRSWGVVGIDRFNGFFLQPNSAGAFFMMSYPVLLWKRQNSINRNTRLFINIIILSAFTLHVLTGSRTTLITSIIGLSIWYIILRKSTKIAIVMVITSVLFFIVLFVYTPKNLSRGEGTSIVTGRNILWTGALIMIAHKPLLGYGFMVEGKIWANQSYYSIDQRAFTISAQQPLHNGYISATVGTGIIGLIIYITILFLPIIKLFRIRSPEYIYIKAFVFTSAIMAIIANLDESFLTGYLGGGDVFFWFVWTIAIQTKEIYLKDKIITLK